MYKKVLIVLVVVASFLIGLGEGANAILGRASGAGYFFGVSDTAGDYVWRPYTSPGPVTAGCSGDGVLAIPMWVDTKDEFINFVLCKLNSNSSNIHIQREDRTGAAFIIQSMRGIQGPSACEGGAGNNCRPSDASINQWIQLIYSFDVNWNTSATYNTNSLYQGNPVANNSSPNDDTFYSVAQTSSTEVIVFTWPGGSYNVRRFCANPLTLGEPAAIPWYAAGNTTVADNGGAADPGDTAYSISSRPGDTVTFSHKIKNLGSRTSYNWYELHNSHSVEGTYEAQYYNNTSLSGSPAFTRYEAGIFHDWSTKGPDSPIGTNNFSVRWNRTDYFRAGTYTFTTATDDGVRLYVDGNLVINDWQDQGVSLNSANVVLSEGRHTIVMEYYQGGGGYYAAMWYSYMDGATKVSTGYDAQYYNNTSLSGSPVVTRVDPEINNNWGTGSPGAGINADAFSARWTRHAYFNQGTYEFVTKSDDGVRLYVDDVLVINNWTDHGLTANAVSLPLTAGVHKIVMEYYENSGGASATLSYHERTQGGTEAGYIAVGAEPTVATRQVIIPGNATPGTRYCQSILWDNAYSTGGQLMYGGGYADMGGMACATVANTYTLVPTVTTDSTYAQVGDTVTFSYRLANTGSGASSALTTCKAVGKVHPPGSPLPEEFADRSNDSGQNPPALSCPASVPGNTSNPTPFATEDVVVPSSLAPGARLCRSLVISPYQSGATYRASAEACVLIAKSPYVHFMGGDVWAGGGFAQPDGTCTTNTGANITTSSKIASGAGSTVEYAAFALGSVTGFGSGSKPLYDPADFSDLGRRLSFANNTSVIGQFGAPQHCMNDRAASYASAPAISGTVNLQSQPSGEWQSAGDLTMYGVVSAGTRQVYVVNGNVTINHSAGSSDYIRYVNGATNNPTYTSVSQVPSLVVVATGDIRVDPSVTDIAGIFISRGTFYTCYPKPSPPTISTCATQLTVNGSVIANALDLYRTYGSDGSTPAERQVPAEVFNLNPELFLNNALSTNSITTSNFRELPPRF